MMITSIAPLDKRRCKVFFEEGFALVLYRGELRRYRLEEGQELADETYQDILHNILFKRARERVVYLLKASDKTEKELRRKLMDGSYPEEAIEYAINLCKKYHYIDDDSYAVRYMEMNSVRKSKRHMVYELQQKGLDKEQIADALDQVPCDEEEQVRRLLKKRKYDRENTDMKEQQKLQGYLMRKGFSGEIIRRIMREEDD